MKVLFRTSLKDDIFIEINKKPPACIDCDYYCYDRGSWCERPSGLKAFNVVTGEYDKYAGPNRCQDQRYSTHDSHCGIEGEFFKPK